MGSIPAILDLTSLNQSFSSQYSNSTTVRFPTTSPRLSYKTRYALPALKVRRLSKRPVSTKILPKYFRSRGVTNPRTFFRFKSHFKLPSLSLQDTPISNLLSHTVFFEQNPVLLYQLDPKFSLPCFPLNKLVSTTLLFDPVGEFSYSPPSMQNRLNHVITHLNPTRSPKRSKKPKSSEVGAGSLKNLSLLSSTASLHFLSKLYSRPNIKVVPDSWQLFWTLSSCRDIYDNLRLLTGRVKRDHLFTFSFFGFSLSNSHLHRYVKRILLPDYKSTLREHASRASSSTVFHTTFILKNLVLSSSLCLSSKDRSRLERKSYKANSHSPDTFAVKRKPWNTSLRTSGFDQMVPNVSPRKPRAKSRLQALGVRRVLLTMNLQPRLFRWVRSSTRRKYRRYLRHLRKFCRRVRRYRSHRIRRRIRLLLGATFRRNRFISRHIQRKFTYRIRKCWQTSKKLTSRKVLFRWSRRLENTRLKVLPPDKKFTERRKGIYFKPHKQMSKKFKSITNICNHWKVFDFDINSARLTPSSFLGYSEFTPTPVLLNSTFPDKLDTRFEYETSRVQRCSYSLQTHSLVGRDFMIFKYLFSSSMESSSSLRRLPLSGSLNNNFFYSMQAFAIAVQTQFAAYHTVNRDLRPDLSNLWSIRSVNQTIRKRLFRYSNSSSFPLDLSVWYYKTLIQFIENCSGLKTSLLLGPFIQNALSLEDKARCSLWNNRVTGFQRIMGGRIFVHEALQIIVTSIRVKDPTLLSNWIRGMLKRLSFWKYRLIFRYVKFVLRYVLKPNFHLLDFRGVKLQLKGKISVAGNARTRTLFMRIGDTSHSKMYNRVAYDLSFVNTFTGILGFKLWFFY